MGRVQFQLLFTPIRILKNEQYKNTADEYRYIFVDLDRTLIRTDLFVESILIFLKQNPSNIFRLVYWLILGRSKAKTLVARHIRIQVDTLPYELKLLEYLRGQKKEGRTIVLTTASHITYARQIAKHLGLFNAVIGSSSKCNNKGKTKLLKIRKLAEGRLFAYTGNSPSDRPIWDAACANIHVNSSSSDIQRSIAQNKLLLSIESKIPIFRAFLKEMRIHQWSKNSLVLIPLVTSHGYYDLTMLVATLYAFFCFSLCASGVYLLNDLLDLASDRKHPTKKLRPLASGDLPLAIGVMGALGLPVIAFFIAGIVLPWAYFVVLASYFLITNAYSFYLKRVSTADVLSLAVLYTLRVIAGAAAISVELSTWLLAFSVFVFVSLAYLKRYIEVAAFEDDSETSDKVPGRGYSHADWISMFTLGVSNGTASVLVLALYISSEDIAAMYPNKDILWLLCLLMLYWNNRIWLGARRGKIHDDPVVFAMKDRVSQLILVGFIFVILAARYL